MTRKACVIQDTDSTMITIKNLVDYMYDKIVPDEVAAENEEELDYIIVNLICYILTKYQKVFYGRYCSDVNMPEDYHWMINMKNEFFYPLLVNMAAKKHYITLTKLQEGMEIKPPKIELHGLEIAKAETSQMTYDFFFGIIKDDIMYADNINVAKILAKIQRFKTMIKESLEHGEKTFLPIASVKEVEAYTNPFSEQGIRGVRAWNFLYPDMMVNLPDKVLLLHLICGKEKVFQANHGVIPQDKYELIDQEIFSSGEKSIRTNGFGVIGLPQNIEKIPEWLIPIIDYDKIINNNVSKFNQILESLGIVLIDTRANDSHASNIIAF
jgi:hypothetical protein